MVIKVQYIYKTWSPVYYYIEVHVQREGYVNIRR